MRLKSQPYFADFENIVSFDPMCRQPPEVDSSAVHHKGDDTEIEQPVLGRGICSSAWSRSISKVP